MCEPHEIYGFKRRTPGRWPSTWCFPPVLWCTRSAELPPAHAAFAEPLSCALHAVERANPTFEDVVVVAGCGPIGLGMIAGAKARSRRRWSPSTAPDKLDLARSRGTDVIDVSSATPIETVKAMTDGYGADVYFEGTGHPSAVGQGLQLLRKLGRYVEYSVFGNEVSVDWTIVSDDKELDVLGAHLGPHCWPTAIELHRVRGPCRSTASAPTSSHSLASRRRSTSLPLPTDRSRCRCCRSPCYQHRRAGDRREQRGIAGCAPIAVPA